MPRYPVNRFLMLFESLSSGRWFLRVGLGLAAVGWIAPAWADNGRAMWKNTRLIGAPGKPSEMTAVRAYPGLPVRRPVAIEREPGTNRLLVLENLAWDEYKSSLKRFVDDPEAGELETLMEIPGTSEVAYSLCFHPRFEENGYFYIGSNGVGPGEQHHSRIVRYTLSRQAPWRVVEGSALSILAWPSNGHNGAAAAFGRDGMLYVTSGDGTPNGDANLAGQDTSALLSKVLRLDVDGAEAGQTYRVPEDNPFLGQAGVRPETWAYGLRNPWRLTSDLETGQIWVGENGQDLWEYAHLLQRGANYGWSAYEGNRVFQAGRLRGPAAVTPPTLEHNHAQFRSLTGGFVYRGSKFPELRGAYIYGDYATGRVWAARHDGAALLWNRELADTALAIAGFGTNAAGDILIADHLGDAIVRLESAPAPAPDRQPFPQRLSETGLWESLADLRPAAGVVPYEINAPSWHDGAGAAGMLALPGQTTATLPMMTGSGPWQSWKLPDGAVLIQTLTLPATGSEPARRMETRLLLKQEADWAAYSYVWNEEQTEATLAPEAGQHVSPGGRPWVVPSRSECVMCHSRGAGYVLSLTAAQLNREVMAGAEPVNQLVALARQGLLSSEETDGRPPSPLTESLAGALIETPAGLPRLVNPLDAGAPLAERAQAYFATNCSHCHRHEGGGNSRMDLSPWLKEEAQYLVNAPPQHGDYNMPEARLIAPGEPGRSVLPVRISSRGPGQMPPVGTSHLDPQGMGLIFEWLMSLDPSAKTER